MVSKRTVELTVGYVESTVVWQDDGGSSVLVTAYQVMTKLIVFFSLLGSATTAVPGKNQLPLLNIPVFDDIPTSA